MSDVTEVVKTTKEVAKAVHSVAPSSDLVQQKVVTMLDALQQGAVTIGHQVVKYAPDVQDAVLGIVRVNGIAALLPNIMGCTIFAIISLKLIKYATSHKKENYSDEKNVFAWIFGSIAGLTSLTLGYFVCNVWAWVAIFQPKLALAKQIVDTVLK